MNLVKLSLPIKYNKLQMSHNIPKQNIIESNCDGAGDDRGSPTPYRPMPTGMLLYISYKNYSPKALTRPSRF